MGTFLKDNSYSMIKLFLNQIGIAVFGLMLSLSTVQNNALHLSLGIFSALFFLFLNYNACWNIGAADKIRIDGGRLKYFPEKGAVLALGANIPNIILALLMGIGALLNDERGQGMGWIRKIISGIINGMYLAIITTIEKAIYGGAPYLSVNWWWYLVIVLPAIFAGWVAYLMGVKNIRIIPVRDKKKN